MIDTVHMWAMQYRIYRSNSRRSVDRRVVQELGSRCARAAVAILPSDILLEFRYIAAPNMHKFLKNIL